MEERTEELLKRVKEMEDRLTKEGKRPIVSPVPDRPTDQEASEHNTTHSPPANWCPHCVKATGTNEAYRRTRREVPDVEAELTVIPTISIDLMYLYEKGERPTLVPVDHESGRVWSYALGHCIWLLVLLVIHALWGANIVHAKVQYSVLLYSFIRLQNVLRLASSFRLG